MLSLAIFGGEKIDGSELVPGERIVGLALFGGMEVDLTAAPAPFVDLLVVALFGGVVVRVRPDQAVRVGGFSIFGGRGVDPRQLPTPDADADDELPLEISAYAVFGGVAVKRVAAKNGHAAEAH